RWIRRRPIVDRARKSAYEPRVEGWHFLRGRSYGRQGERSLQSGPLREARRRGQALPRRSLPDSCREPDYRGIREGQAQERTGSIGIGESTGSDRQRRGKEHQRKMISIVPGSAIGITIVAGGALESVGTAQYIFTEKPCQQAVSHSRKWETLMMGI